MNIASNNDQSSYAQNPPKLITKQSFANELRMPDIQFPDSNSEMDFQTQSCKLIQANTILSEMIKEHLLEKYRIIEKIIRISQHIKKMENKNNPK